jgi:hypothetical protein
LCAIGWSVWCLDRLHLARTYRAAIGIGVALTALGLWLAAFPAVLRGVDGIVDTPDMAAYFGVIAEMRPIATLRDACVYLSDGTLATLAAVIVAVRARSLWWGYTALCGGVLLAIGASHLRFATYDTVFAASMLPFVLTWCERELAPQTKYAKALGSIAVLGAFFVVPALGNALGQPSPAGTASSSACTLANIGGLLAPYDGLVVMADPSDTPELLYRSKVRTVGSLYANIAGFMRLRAAWRAVPGDDIPESVKATRASLLLFCPHPGRSSLVADLPPDTLFDRLNRQVVPRWLARIGTDAKSGYVLYRIDAAD